MADDIKVRKEQTKPRDKLAARVASNFDKATKAKKAALELTMAPGAAEPEDWQIFAFGPWQTPEDRMPGRIIKKGETAYIAIVVWMNDAMCSNVTGWSGKIELNIWTSDMQEMKKVGALHHYCCIETKLDHCWYVYVWEFSPPEAACLYETNICARLCNCDDKPNAKYAGFVRHVYDFDPETLWPTIPDTILPDDFPDDTWPPGPEAPASWGFDRPIRYMVYDPEDDCECEPDNFCEDVLSAPA
jgi:hypothetical protein